MIIAPHVVTHRRVPHRPQLNRAHPFANDVLLAMFFSASDNARRVVDSGPFHFTGTLPANGSFADTPYGRGYVPATSSAVVIPASDNHQAVNEVTIVARVNGGTDSGRNWIVIRGSNPINYWLTPHDNTVDLGSGVGFYNAGYNKSGINTNIMNDGKWHTLAGTIKNEGSGARLRYFVDGKLDAENTTASNMPSVSYALNIGSYDGDGSYFNGTIEFVIVLKRALSPAMVAWMSADPYSLIASAQPLPPAVVAGSAARRPVLIVAS